MTIIDFMLAHPFISLFMVWATGNTVTRSVHYIANAATVRAQLNRGIPIAEVVQLNKAKTFSLQLGDGKDEE